MFVKVNSAAVQGVDATPISVESNTTGELNICLWGCPTMR